MLTRPFKSPSAASFLDNIRLARLKALVRRGEVALVILAALVGVAAGALVALVGGAARLLHWLIFGAGSLSASGLSGPVVVLGPVAGGVLLGLFSYGLSRRKRRKAAVDPIEANALHGGRMPLGESVNIVIQNLLSNGFGASVGLEAAYTQIAAGVASKLGMWLQLRRGDLRTLVGCGAAGAISAAFDAPLTGAFYAVELIIGAYSPALLAPVMVSALAAKLVVERLVGHGLVVGIGAFGQVVPADYAPAIVLGLVCALAGILLMQAVALVEALVRRLPVPACFRPALGGLAVGGLALISPQVLSAGHGALHINLHADASAAALAGLVGLKIAASALSIGAGFRGGLFFASLFIGALLGQVFAALVTTVYPTALTPAVYAMVGMSALGAAVVGAPLAMTFLALEMTGDFPITVLVLAAVITTSLVVRLTFGYSFATWRFHLRGETIRSAHDVGWIRDLTVGRMMRPDLHTAPLTMTVGAFRHQFPLGSTQRVVVVDDAGRYAGLALVPEVHAAAEEPGLAPLLHCRDEVLVPEMNVREAAAAFERAHAEALVVVADRSDNRPVGLLSEAHALRRYSETMDLRQKELAGES